MKRPNLLSQHLLLLFFFLTATCLCGQEYSIQRQTTGMTGSSSSINIDGHPFLIQQCIGQASVIGTYASTQTTLRQGFLQANSLKVSHLSSTKSNIRVYPNPFRNSIHLELEEELLGEARLQINDLMGRIVFEKKYTGFLFTDLDLSFLRTGSYILQIHFENKLFSAQIQKK